MAKKKSLAWLNCSEGELAFHLKTWVCGLKNSVILLEGPMGAGKSTFMRHLLALLAPGFESEGSPTFSLVQTYEAQAGYPIYHIDLYRIEDEADFNESGIEEQIEALGALSCVEWTSRLPNLYRYWTNPKLTHAKNVWCIEIEVTDQTDLRNFKIHQIYSLNS